VNFLADEGVDRQIVEHLRQNDHQVLYVAEFAPGTSDDVILSQANDIQAPLLTADKDFGELVHRQGLVHAGVILIRLAGLSPEAKAEIVATVVQEHGSELLRAFSVISPGLVRVRKSDSN
jgi:predicted nuclease of predicted toxin-antitoxin system